jgi:UDP-glucose 4-epimerase
MRILVTGALGFIGSNIVEQLVREGHEVVALDNQHTGNEQNIQEVKEKVTLVEGNAGDIKNMEEKFDVIFHQGIYSSSPMYQENPHLVSSVIEDWISILEYAKKNKTKVVWASTSSVYSSQEPPHHEDMEVKITGFYSEARYAMERLSKLYSNDVSVIGLRYFSVYGPHEKSKGKYANLISQFLWALQKDETPVVYGDGSQTRDFTYVDDVVAANALAMKRDLKFGIFNVGTGKSITINEMIDLLNKKLGKDIKPKYIENPITNYVQHTLADTTKAEKELGFKAKISLEQGIDKLIEYYS